MNNEAIRVQTKTGWSVKSSGPGRMSNCWNATNITAAVAEVSVKGDEVKVLRLVLSTNCGHAVNPDQIAAQVEGSVAYAFDTLQSQSSVANGRMVNTNFDSYPIARLRQLPRIETVIAPTFDFWGGVGEPTICVVAPAILNAIFAATGKPMRNLPLKNHGLRIV